MKRCKWCNLNNKLYVDYHDYEWGTPVYDDHKLFELLLLESFQAGLSWETILNKRNFFKASFDDFDFYKISKYSNKKIEELLTNKNIIRCKRKITAAINNAKIFINIIEEWGSFSSYIWHFTNNKVIINTTDELPVKNELSDIISKDLKSRGMKYVGSVIIYSYLQAIGIINDHELSCYKNPVGGYLKKYKKVYIEITNKCNLACDFCIKNKRVLKDISIDEFKIILEKLKPVTDYLYFHILGEPLIHPKINELIDIASKSFKINLTTNGYFIDKIKDNKNLRQVNISLHSFDDRYHVSLAKYLNNIFNSIDKLISNKTYISLRLWVKTKYYENIIEYINNKYNCNITLEKGSYKVNDYLFINDFREFIWPDLNNKYYNEFGTCYGLRDHFGILVDGTIVPCCLDTKGIINLGNIYKEELNIILNNDRCIKMVEGFEQNKKCEELCKHCSFIEKQAKVN